MASLTAERRNRMAKILLSEGSIKVGAMAELFDVSTETIRKDIIFLEKKGLAEKSFGGAIAKTSLVEKPLNERALVQAEAKAAIAARAIDLIPDHATVLLDTGSTTNAIATHSSWRTSSPMQKAMYSSAAAASVAARMPS